MKHAKFITVGLVSVSLIALELVWTRIFSAEYFYTFAFLILSLAILGLGLGALAVNLFPVFGRRKNLWLYVGLTGLCALIGPPIVFRLNMDFAILFSSMRMIAKLLIIIIMLSSAYFFGGISLTNIFKNDHRDMPRLYMADLIGAGTGVVVSILFMDWFGTQNATFLIAIPVIIGALISSSSWKRIFPVLLIFLMILFSINSEPVLKSKRQDRAEVVYTHWDAMAKLKIYDFDGFYRGIEIDNIANSPVYPFDGDFNKPDSLKFSFGIDVSYLIQQFDSCTFLSLGAGGGVDVLQALQAAATEVHAVEVNSHINYIMTDGELADYSGNIYNDPRVMVVTEDARAYVRRFTNKFDVIYSLSSNTFAAFASGSFALAENYLFTTEAFQDYWNALSDSGFMMMEHQFYVPRLVTEFQDALEKMDIQDVNDHFAVYNLPKMRRKILFISKQPLTPEIRHNAFGELTEEKFTDIHLLYPAADSLKENLINRIVVEGWQNVQNDSPINLSPSTDNRPFSAQLGMWKNVHKSTLKTIKPYEFFGFPLSRIIIIIILAVVIVFMLPLVLLPYVLPGKKLKAVSWMYFFTIGMAFMMLEIILIQKYTLFIGPSVYTLIVILTTLLLGSGIGSRYSKCVKDWIPFAGIVVWLLFDITVFNVFKTSLGTMTVAPRILVTVILIFPLGFFMGMPFPKAVRKVGELVDWGFAVNGIASTIGSTIIILTAFSAGYTVSLVVAGLFYSMAYMLLRLKNNW